MKIGDEIYVHGYVDEIRSDVVIIRNEGGYFGTVEREIFAYEEDERGYGTMNEADRNSSEKPNNCEPQTKDLFTDKDGDVWEWRGDAWYCISGDEPQTFDKPPKCLGCLYSDLDKAFHPCASCVDFGKYVGEVSGEDKQQTDCPWK